MTTDSDSERRETFRLAWKFRLLRLLWAIPVAVVVLLFAALVIGGMVENGGHAATGSNSTSAPAAAPTQKPPSGHTVVYRVTLSNGATWSTITYQNMQGGAQQIMHQDGDWSVTFPGVPIGAHVNMNALNGTDSNGDIACEIDVDGQSFRSSTSSGPSSMVTCSGFVGHQ